MPRPASWVRFSSILLSRWLSAAFDLRVTSFLALEEQLAASRHKMEEAHLREVLLMKDHERVVVARIRQGADITLTALKLRIGRDFRQVAPRFLDHASQAE